MESYEQRHSHRIQVRLRQRLDLEEEEWQVAIIWPQRVLLLSNSTREAAELEIQRKLVSEGHQCDSDCGGWIHAAPIASPSQP
jgi:IS5 family transposase